MHAIALLLTWNIWTAQKFLTHCCIKKFFRATSHPPYLPTYLPTYLPRATRIASQFIERMNNKQSWRHTINSQNLLSPHLLIIIVVEVSRQNSDSLRYFERLKGKNSVKWGGSPGGVVKRGDS